MNRDADRSMRVVLDVTAGPHEGQVFAFDQHDNFIVGRSKQAHFQLASKDKYFSRIHFMVEVNPPHCRLTDLNSRNGTVVNGQKVAAVDLKHGDEIKAGRTILRVSVHGSEATTTLPRAFAQNGAAVLRQSNPVGSGKSDGHACDAHAHPLTVDGYQILKELGRGGMGVVYQAKRESDGTVVAIKTVIPAVAGSAKQLDRFFREAHILRDLDHPSIVAFLDMGDSNGRLFFVMEYVSGTDAGRLLKEQGPLPISRAVGLVCQLLQALEYAHAKDYVHRDIKPANLLVVGAPGLEVVRLADFGLARVYQTSQLSGLTMMDEVGGTPAFMAPEQITQFREAKPAADQYAAAATLYNLLTGKHVFDFSGKSTDQMLMILQNEPVPIQSRRTDIPNGLAELIHRALAKEPGKRFAGAKEMRRTLLNYGPR
jgi:eukaryotic-like serine/threonine-protein kinase